MSRIFQVLTAIGLVMLLGLAGWRIDEALKRQAAASGDVVATAAPVEVARLSRQPLHEVAMLAGMLRPLNEVDVVADVGGRVLSLQADIGDTVGKGDVLARLEDDALSAGAQQARAAVAAARAGLDGATADREAAEKLFVSQNMSELQLSGSRSRQAGAKAQLDQAEAALRLAEQRLDDATIRSPISGVVTDRSVGLGRMVNPGGVLFHVQDVSSLELELAVDEPVALKLSPATVVLVIAGDRQTPGTVRVAAPSLDPRTRRMKVLVSVPPEGLIPYTTAAARVVLAEREALAVPRQAVVDGEDGPYVVVVRQGQARHVSVIPGISEGELIEVVADGLAEGEAVVVAGASGVLDGAAVSPREATP